MCFWGGHRVAGVLWLRQAESVAAIVLIIRMLLIPPAPLLRQEV